MQFFNVTHTEWMRCVTDDDDVTHKCRYRMSYVSPPSDVHKFRRCWCGVCQRLLNTNERAQKWEKHCELHNCVTTSSLTSNVTFAATTFKCLMMENFKCDFCVENFENSHTKFVFKRQQAAIKGCIWQAVRVRPQPVRSFVRSLHESGEKSAKDHHRMSEWVCGWVRCICVVLSLHIC